MSNAESLDMSILSAMFKQNGISLNQRKAQLRMALELDRADYARQVVFNSSNADYRLVSSCILRIYIQ